MNRNVFLLVRGLILIAASMLAIMFVTMIIDLNLTGNPLQMLLHLNSAEARHLNNAISRNLNQLLAVTFTTVAIAVPLTANMYSLKFLEFFLKDKVNASVLTFVVFADLNNTWVAYSIKDTYVPQFQIHLSLFLVIVGFTLLFPYLYYVFRFLHPHTLLSRLEEEITGDLTLICRRPGRAAEHRRQVSEAIEHVANITIRSIDRLDRSTAIESIFCLERLTLFYWKVKPRLPESWFTADPNSFLGFSAPAIEELSESRSWVEMKLFHQLRQITSIAVGKTYDVISSTAKTLRWLGCQEAARHEAAVREMVMEYFNTLVRLCIQKRDPRAVFIIFDQYRQYADVLNAEYPEVVLEIAYYFEYYGQIARDTQLPFLVESIAHDLGTIVRNAWEKNAKSSQALLQRLLHYDSRSKTPLAGVKKAHAILASYFLLRGLSEPADLIKKSFSGLDSAFISTMADDLMQVKRKKYWEVNERRTNMDYIPEDQRIKLQEFLTSIG